jgi:hypothetical protein
MFDNLMAEVAEINELEGWVGCFDAIQYIYENRDEYAGTKVYKEIGIFMRQGAELFKEKA